MHSIHCFLNSKLIYRYIRLKFSPKLDIYNTYNMSFLVSQLYYTYGYRILKLFPSKSSKNKILCLLLVLIHVLTINETIYSVFVMK